jgi:putative ABC transport system permease protein
VSRLPVRSRCRTSPTTPTIVTAGPEGVRYYRHRVTPGYFGALGVPLVRGRGFTADDDRDAERVAVIGAAMAARFWPSADPVGRRVRLGGPDGPAVTIVGVVGDVRQRDLTGNLLTPGSEPDVYFPFAQSTTSDLEIAVRGAGDPASLAPMLRREVAALDAGLPLFRVQPLATALRQQTATGRFASLVLGLFSGVALLLAAVGIYGVLSFLVGLSRREIAIRMALGATSSRVMAATIGRGVALAAAGLVVGIALAALTTDVLSAQLFGVEPTDPLTFAGVSLVLLLVAVAAAWVPASRATRVDPQMTLRSE